MLRDKDAVPRRLVRVGQGIGSTVMQNGALPTGFDDRPDEVVDWEDLGRRVRMAADQAAEEWMSLAAFMNPAVVVPLEDVEPTERRHA